MKRETFPDFFENPVLNSPYELPRRHWHLDAQGQPTGGIDDGRRESSYVSPVAQPQGRADSGELGLDSGEYETYHLINEVRAEVTKWRELPSEKAWNVTPETSRLLGYWRTHKFSRIRPFFCQIEAVEILIWLTEVAPQDKKYQPLLKLIVAGNEKSNPELFRIALKLATGAGKTTVMAMIIAWQVINAVRHPGSDKFSRAFLVIAPGLTIRDRLRVLNPADPDEYYFSRELVPPEFKLELGKAKICVTNYQSFIRRARIKDLATRTKELLQGPCYEPAPIAEDETEGEMLARVIPEFLSEKTILVINDEAHHCYRAKPESEATTETRQKDERKEEKDRNEAARVWISGIEALAKHCKKLSVVDLSATPFFLRGSGYKEGTLFPWTVSDFSIMDAIECGIVKLPRVPVSDNSVDMFPKYRNLWENVKKDLPRTNAKKAKTGTPDNLPALLCGAIEALYQKYKETSDAWEKANMNVPPCFIFVCQNTAISKLVYDYVSGWKKEDSNVVVAGKCPLFRNFDEHGNALDRPRTILVDSVQLESGEISDDFKIAAAEELAAFKRDKINRDGASVAEKIPDSEILREVMNTVGKEGKLGANVRCVVSVSMLTEGWDANNVTHILGIRAFGTQLLCEQVVGRALRRSGYELDETGLFPAEYADIFGVPFSFCGRGVVAAPTPPRPVTTVCALSPERDSAEISFPNVAGYARKSPDEKLSAEFDPRKHGFTLSSQNVGPTTTILAPIVGKTEVASLDDLKKLRENEIIFHLTVHLLEKHFRSEDGNLKIYLFGQLKAIVALWMKSCLNCTGGAMPSQILYAEPAEKACEFIAKAITDVKADVSGEHSVSVILNSYTPTGSTRFVHFPTTKSGDALFKTSAKNHVNYAVLDSNMERNMCKILENCDDVKFWTRNFNLGFEIPYTFGDERHAYVPDFIAVLQDGTKLIIETKGYDSEQEHAKFATVEDFWIHGVNARGEFGRWAFKKFGPYTDFSEYSNMENEFRSYVKKFKKI